MLLYLFIVAPSLRRTFFLSFASLLLKVVLFCYHSLTFCCQYFFPLIRCLFALNHTFWHSVVFLPFYSHLLLSLVPFSSVIPSLSDKHNRYLKLIKFHTSVHAVRFKCVNGAREFLSSSGMISRFSIECPCTN